MAIRIAMYCCSGGNACSIAWLRGGSSALTSEGVHSAKTRQMDDRDDAQNNFKIPPIMVVR